MWDKADSRGDQRNGRVKRLWIIHISLFFLHFLFAALWVINETFFTSGPARLLSLGLLFYYLIQSGYLFLQSPNSPSFFSTLLPSVAILLALAFPLYVSSEGTQLEREQMNYLGHFANRVEYRIRRNEFLKDIKLEKARKPDVNHIEWLPMSGGPGPLFVYSETELPANEWVRHRELPSDNSNKNSYRAYRSVEGESIIYGEKGDINDCLGYLIRLDKNFYAFLNGDCH